MRLRDIIDQGPVALTELAERLPAGDVMLDCAGIEHLAPDDLNLLLAHIPSDWDVLDLAEVIDQETISPAFGEQLAAWLAQRLLSPSVPVQAPTTLSATEMRELLLKTFVDELHGPANGPTEIIDGSNVRGRYLVGMLAPKGATAFPEQTDELDGAGVDGEDGIAEGRPSKAASRMLSSSIGLSFTVAPDAETIVIRARWGRYHRRKIEDPAYRNEKGELRAVWQREQIDVWSEPFRLNQPTIPRWEPNSEQPEVYVEGIIRSFSGQRVVTLFLVNGQKEKRPFDAYWLFQPELTVKAADDAAIFEKRVGVHKTADLEAQSMTMLYRRRVEFAVGHGVAVDTEREPGQFDRARLLRTTVIPRYELPQTVPVSAADDPLLEPVAFDMQALANVPDGGFTQALGGLLDAYAVWINRQAARLSPPEADLVPHQDPGRIAIQRCRETLERMRAGLTLLDTNQQAAAAFRFANRAMAMQRVRTLFTGSVRRGAPKRIEEFDAPQYHSWRPFQLGFILLNLPGLTDLAHPDRAVGEHGDPAQNIADLLWFPTGGGKTEAYLGLTAYTIAIRRLQGDVGGRDGHNGVAVLMRYTLRLLTFQQFQRAATLICACEVIRRENEAVWGTVPIRLGLWVGAKATPNSVEDAEKAIADYRNDKDPSRGTPHQLTSCPWCGEKIEPGRHLEAQTADRGVGRVFTYCGSLLDLCPFNRRMASKQGLPVMVVDEEIYNHPPALLIATVDKFAQMPWNGKTAALFGRVSGRCERHGFRTPDTEDEDSHRAVNGLPAAKTIPTPLLRPPDLIIQDELHLISGPLGTLVGLYETAVDALASWEVNGVRVRPKVVASTATIRRASEQLHGLFWRQVAIFPPQGLDVEDNFFARQREGDPNYPGRLYVGICSPGIRHRFVLIQTYVALMAAAQYLFENGHGRGIDPWMTLVGYFNSLRELAAMRRSVDDSVRTRLRRMDQRGLARRFIDSHHDQNRTSVQELTSRLSASDIPRVLDRLELLFDPEARKRPADSGPQRKGPAKPTPIDVLLATNMISVGVDVGRLGLMVVAGQPKATAEYIQATSRVGRNTPGLVVTVYNWGRPRDMSHYERFSHYHATFYQYVEALSVTPFSARAIDRGVMGVLAALARLCTPAWNANRDAHVFDRQNPAVQGIIDLLRTRAAAIAGPEGEQRVVQAIEQRLDGWVNRRDTLSSARLTYKREKNATAVLLKAPEEQGDTWDMFTCLNSLRDVEASVNLVLQDQHMDDGARQSWVFTGVAAPVADDTEDAVEGEEIPA